MSKKKSTLQPKQENWKFAGFALPTTTPVPDQVFDELLYHLSPTEMVVLLYIVRRTFGFRKMSDNISLKQLCEGIITKDGRVLDRGTGLSKSTVSRALKSLEKKNVIKRKRRRSKKKGDEPTTYELNFLTPVSQNETGGVSPVRHGGVSESNTQQTVMQETVNTVNGNKSLLRNFPDLNQPQEKTAYIAQHILDELGDTQSEDYYNLVAAKVPEDVIRRAIAEIKQDGAKKPAAVFTHRMEKYALEQLKEEIGEENLDTVRYRFSSLPQRFTT